MRAARNTCQDSFRRWHLLLRCVKPTGQKCGSTFYIAGLAFVAGIGLLRRRRFGIIAFFALCILRLILRTAVMRDRWELGFFVALTLVAFFLPNLIYFKRRWRGLK